jgi:G6PDH family F420-dependent oxidoreductase
MTEIGWFLATEEHDATTVLRTARQVEEAGIQRVCVTDHFHPWNGHQDESLFVWSVLGAVAATTELQVTTAVTCPLIRIHPVIVAQAAATTATMMPGRFTLGVGTGEALNEEILGDPWPPAPRRIEMLGEAIDLMRELWQGGLVNWHGRHYTVTGARIFTLPDEPVPVAISAFGPRAMDLVASHGDGWITTSPDQEKLAEFRAHGKGPAIASVKLCWHEDVAEARRLAHELWPHLLLPGTAGQDLGRPDLFEAATSRIGRDAMAEVVPCGPDPEAHLAAIRPYVEAGFDELYLHQIGPDQDGFLNFYEKELRPRLTAVRAD